MKNWKYYIELTKPRILVMQLVTLALGFIIAKQGNHIFIPLFYFTLLGTALVAGGSTVFNNVLEKNSDKLMNRTKNRALPTEKISVLNAILFGSFLSLSGLYILYAFVNTLTFIIGFLTLFLYVLVYTPLKKRSWSNTIIGAIPGALPPLGGWAAAVGELHVMGWILFLILFIWQLPHFYAIAWLYKEDYANAGFKMLSVMDDTGKLTSRQMLMTSILLLIISITPFFLGMAGLTYFIGVSLIGVWMIKTSLDFSKTYSQQHAKKMIKVSVFYLLLFLALIFIDNIIASKFMFYIKTLL